MRWLVMLPACMMRDAEAPPAEQVAPLRQEELEMMRDLGYAEGDAPPPTGGGARAAKSMAPGAPAASPVAADEGGEKDAKEEAKPAPADDAGPAARAWFPETFLWLPLVETSASGDARVPVRVPDTLTTWRVLALAQTRAGAQGGDVATFASTLPAWVDVDLPAFLYAGDAPIVGVRVVNETGEPLTSRLDVEVDGGTGAGSGAVSLAARGSKVERVRLVAGGAGTLRVAARLGELDAAVREVPVRPVGRPVDQARGGTLAGPRELALSASPGSTGGSLELTVFPGALGVVRNELDGGGPRDNSVASAAYTWALAAAATPKVAEIGADPEDVRAVGLRALQRITRDTRSPSVEIAVDGLAGLRGAPDDTLAGRLAERLAGQVEDAQQPDGLWGLYGGATIGQVLAHTARCAWALGPSAEAARLRAGGAFERQRARWKDDPYLSAWALAAGLLEGVDVDAARATVRDGLRVDPDGSRTLRAKGPRADGGNVPEGEATSLAILALPADDPLRPDLAAGLLGLWTPSSGFGDGAADLVALRALADVFSGEVPREVTLRLEVDGVEVARGTLDAAAPYAPVRLRAPGLTGTGEHAVRVVAEPAVPGLAFTLVARDWLAWTEVAGAGLDLAVTPPRGAIAGEPAVVDVAVAGPSGARVDVAVGLPAGARPDEDALRALQASGRVASWRAEEGSVTLQGLTLDGGRWEGQVPVTPTLAGTLRSGPSRAWPSRDEASATLRAPVVWVVR